IPAIQRRFLPCEGVPYSAGLHSLKARGGPGANPSTEPVSATGACRPGASGSGGRDYLEMGESRYVARRKSMEEGRRLGPVRPCPPRGGAVGRERDVPPRASREACGGIGERPDGLEPRVRVGQ